MSVAVTLQVPNPLLPAATSTLRTTMLPGPDTNFGAGPASHSPRKPNQTTHGRDGTGYDHTAAATTNTGGVEVNMSSVDERPALSRTNTDQILDYYQSEDAGRLYEQPVTAGGDTGSGSDGRGRGPGDEGITLSTSPTSVYSASNSDGTRRVGSASTVASAQEVQAPQARRRMSTRSAGGEDKRRVAIIEMDDLDSDVPVDDDDNNNSNEFDLNQLSSRQPSGSSTTSAYSFSDSSFYTTTPSSSPSVSASPSSNGGSAAVANNTGATASLLTRRGIDGLRFGKLAFVAPPDASPSAYTNLTPPLSAPPQTQNILSAARPGERIGAANAPLASAPSVVAHHQRSQSEAVGVVAKQVVPSKRHPNRLRKGSRDIGIVGTSFSPTTGLMKMESQEAHASESPGVLPDQVSPIFQRPSLSEAPSYSSECSTSNGAGTVKNVAVAGSSHTPSKSTSSTSTSSSSHPNTSLMSNDVKSPSSQPHTAHQTAARASPIGPVVVGLAPQQYWQVPALASTGYAHYAVMSQANGTVLTTAQYVPLSSVVSSPSGQLHRPPSSSPSSSSSPASTPMSASSSQTHASSNPSSSTSPSSSNANMLLYQPGRDATAGPLPSPPRQVIPLSPNTTSSGPPPRPPRMKAPASNGSNSSASDKEKHQSDTTGGSGSTPRALTSRPSNASISRSPVAAGDHIMPSSSTMSTLVDSQSEEPSSHKLKSAHTREGAFPPSSVFITQPTPPKATDTNSDNKKDREKVQSPLKHKNTMDELVRDVSNAIEEAEGRTNGATGLRRGGSLSMSISESGHSYAIATDARRDTNRSAPKNEQPNPLIDRSPVQSPDSDYSSDPMESAKPLPTSSNDPFAHPPPTSFVGRSEAEQKSAVRSKSPQRQLLDFAAKRFSALPRPPSRLSVSRNSQRSSVSGDRSIDYHSLQGLSNNLSHSQLPSTPSPRTKKVYLPKVKSMWPDAMEFKHDVLKARSSVERSRRYAEKINELANHDSGLGDWVLMMRIHLTQTSKQTNRRSVSPSYPRGPSIGHFGNKTRHVSHGSIGSEVTFPKRIDAYIATDLSARPSESGSNVPEGPPPTLPYPSLAQGLTTGAVAKLDTSSSKSRTGTIIGSGTPSMRSTPLSPNSSSKSGGGFFASIGRKASMKRDGTLKSIGNGSTTSSPGAKLLSKRHQQTVPNPRPVQLTAQPALPGGPRAPPNRIQRAQSVIAGKSAAPSIAPSSYAESESELGHSRSFRRSPSVAPSTTSSARGPPPPLPPRDFDKQLAKLADLMPNADRTILAGYLRRTGSDIVAIGQYLEDQKNGCLKRG